MSHWDIKCDLQEYRVLSITKYNAEGTVISSSNSQGNWSAVVPESIGEVVYRLSCKKLARN